VARPKLPIYVRSSLVISRSVLTERQELHLREAFTYDNPDFHKRERLGFWTGNIPRFVESYEATEEDLLLPRGGREKIEKVLGAANVEWLDRREYRDPVRFMTGPTAKRLKFRPDQEALVRTIVEQETALIRAATGSGKTEVVIEAIRQIGQPALVVVWTSALLKQWVTRVCERWGWKESAIGIVGDGRFRVRDLTIAMQQSLVKHPEVLDRFGVFVGDEVQRWGARSFRDLVGKIPARWRIGVSADERRKDRLDAIIHDTFGGVAAEVTREELIARGSLCDVEIVVIPTETRVQEIEDTPKDERSGLVGRLWAKILDVLSFDEERSRMIASLAAEQARSERSVLVFSDRVAHVRDLSRRISLDEGVPCGTFLGGKENREAFDETRERLDSGRIRVAAGTSCVYQGLDIPRLEVGIVATPTAANRQLLEQQIGRLRRKFPGKTKGILFYVWDQHIFPSHLSLLRRWYPGAVRVLEG
jgi:superfamily II DNA or RNA helicase